MPGGRHGRLRPGNASLAGGLRRGQGGLGVGERGLRLLHLEGVLLALGRRHVRRLGLGDRVLVGGDHRLVGRDLALGGGGVLASNDLAGLDPLPDLDQ